MLSSPAVSDGTVYVGSEDGSLYAYNLPAAAQAPRRRDRPPSTRTTASGTRPASPRK